MGIQKQVYTSLAVAVPGAKVTPDQSVYTPYNYLCGDDDGIKVGGFAFMSDEDGYATAVDGTQGKLLGFVERVINYPNYDVNSEGSLVVPKDYGLTIAVRGDYYVEAPGAVAVGDNVMCDDTGAVADGGAISTGWVYRTAADAAGDIVIISNWTLA